VGTEPGAAETKEEEDETEAEEDRMLSQGARLEGPDRGGGGGGSVCEGAGKM
jgi:hypothetical protein